MVREITITWPRRRPYQSVLQFKITLLDTGPPVWRRIQVPEYYTFYDLHLAIQDAMGWLDSHLHDLKIQPLRRACLDIRIESPFALDDLEEATPLLTTEVAVADFIQEPGDRALYTYDYGDLDRRAVSPPNLPPRSQPCSSAPVPYAVRTSHGSRPVSPPRGQTLNDIMGAN